MSTWAVSLCWLVVSCYSRDVANLRPSNFDESIGFPPERLHLVKFFTENQEHHSWSPAFSTLASKYQDAEDDEVINFGVVNLDQFWDLAVQQLPELAASSGNIEQPFLGLYYNGTKIDTGSVGLDLSTADAPSIEKFIQKFHYRLLFEELDLRKKRRSEKPSQPRAPRYNPLEDL